MRIVSTVVATLLLTLPAMTSANAMMQCGPRKIITQQLKQKYRETSGGLGLASGILFEIWSAPDTGTFTILTTTPQNISCIMAAGRDWSFRKIKPQVKNYEH